MKDRLNPALERVYPFLFSAGYRVSSLKDKRYNCIAWAAREDKTSWWEPSKKPGNYWPDEVPLDYSFGNFVRLFQFLGYTQCQNSELECGFRKVVLYKHSDGSFTHVARQLEDGRWISKLGEEEDIEHKTPEALTSADYGSPEVFLRKRIPLWEKMKALRILGSFLKQISGK